MAKTIPRLIPDEDFNNSPAEKEVYLALQALPDNYSVFHSIEWQAHNHYHNVRFGESDFTIFVPQRGLLVVEVKGGAIAYEDGRIIQTNRKTGQKKQQKPLEQANKSVYYFRDILNEQFPFRIPIFPMVWFPDCRRQDIHGTLPHNYAEDIVLTKDDFEHLAQTLDRVCNHYNMPIVTDLDEKLQEKLTDILAPEFHAIPTASTMAEYQERIFCQMTQQQCYLIDYLQEIDFALIQGPAGTGKTMLALEKARQLNRRGESVLFLLFNHHLVKDLQKKYAHEMPLVKFANIHGYVANAMNQNVTDEDITSFLKTSLKQGRWPYKHIIIDEGQDLADWNKYLYKIAQQEHGCCYIFYDKHQLVQKRNLDWIKMFECRLVLTRNCRNTKSIAKTSGAPIDLTEIKMRREDTGVGLIPRFFAISSKQDYLNGIQKLCEYYLQQDFRPEQITLLTLNKLTDSTLYNHVCNHPRSALGKLIAPDERTTDRILLTTARKFKGLESPVVIIVDLNKDVFIDDESRRNFYVGASRARNFLELIGNLTTADEKDMACQLTHQEDVRIPRFTLIRELNINIGQLADI